MTQRSGRPVSAPGGGLPVNPRFIPVRVEEHRSVPARSVLRAALVVVGLGLFLFGWLNALGGVMSHMALHLPAQIVGIALIATGVTLRPRHDRSSAGGKPTKGGAA